MKRPRRPEQRFAMMLKQPMQRSSGKWPIDDFALSFGPIRYLPGFADGNVSREIFFIKRRQISTAPDALLENRFKAQWVEHVGIQAAACSRSATAPKLRNF